MRVITYGTFDTLHFGHFELLRRASEMGSQLFVGVSTDEFNKTKGKDSCFPYLVRKKWIESLRFVDCVIPETSWVQKELDIKRLNIDVFVMGDDWEGHFDHLPCHVVYVPRTPNISSTLMKSAIANNVDQFARAMLPDSQKRASV